MEGTPLPYLLFPIPTLFGAGPAVWKDLSEIVLVYMKTCVENKKFMSQRTGKNMYLLN